MLPTYICSQLYFCIGSGCAVAPYAMSSPDWIERIVNSHCHWNESPDNALVATHQPNYINIAPDGSLDLPRHLRNIVEEFEQLYENTRYKRLQPCGRRRSVGGAVDADGNSVYDRLQLRVISPTTACQGNRCSKDRQRSAASKKEHKKRHSDPGLLKEFTGVLQENTRSMEMGIAKQRRRRRFSVDIGQVREFIALREMMISTKEQSSA